MMANNNKNSVSYQFISKDVFDLVSDNLTSINHLNPVPKRDHIRPLTSSNRHFGMKGSNYFNSHPLKYNLKYLPKRKIRNTFIAPPTHESLMPIKSQEPMEVKEKIKEEFKYQSNVNNTCSVNNDYLKIRTSYILKFASNSDYFNKTRKYFDFLSEEKKGPVVDLYDHLKKIYELNSRVYFSKINVGSPLSYETWKDLLKNSFEYNSLMIKLIDLLFNDLKNDKDHILRLTKKNFELDTQISSKSNEIALINDFIKKNDLNAKFNQKKQKNISVQDLRQTYIQKENAYVLTIYRLEDEIKELSSLLEQNKIATTKLQNSKKKAENRKKTMDEMRVVYNKEINDLNLRNSITKEEGENLNEQIAELEKYKKTSLFDIDNLNTTIFEINKKNQMYKRVIDQRLEIINMVQEESAMYKYLYDKEQQLHKITNDKLLKHEAKAHLPKL